MRSASRYALFVTFIMAFLLAAVPTFAGGSGAILSVTRSACLLEVVWEPHGPGNFWSSYGKMVRRLGHLLS